MTIRRLLTPHHIREAIALALPILVSMIAQNILTTIDVAMLKHIDQSQEYITSLQAAAQFGGKFFFLTIAFIVGIGSAVQVLTAKDRAAGTHAYTRSLNMAMVITLIMGTILMLIFYFTVPPIIQYFVGDQHVAKEATDFFVARNYSYVFIAFSMAFRGFWNGINRSLIFMISVILTVAFNIFFNWVLIYGHWGAPKLELIGAGYASSIASILGVIFYAFMTHRAYKNHGLWKIFPSKDHLKSMFKIMIPASLHLVLMSLGFFLFSLMIQHKSKTDFVAAGFLELIMMFAVMPSVGLGMAASTFIGRALGHKNEREAQLWPYRIALISIILNIFILTPSLLMPNMVLSLFSSDPKIIQLSILPLWIMSLFQFITATAPIFMYSLQAIGQGTKALIISFGSQWLFFLPFTYWAVHHSNLGIQGIWIVFVAQQVLTSLAYIFLWHKTKSFSKH